MVHILRKNAVKLLVLLSFLSTVSYSQTNSTLYKILGISVEGNKSADVNTIIASSGLKVGDEIKIPGDQTLSAIKQLYALDIFSDIEIIKDKQVGNGLFITIKVKEYPRYEKYVVEGNDDLSDDDIEKKISLIRGQILKPQDIQSIKNSLMKEYDDDGYLNADINIKEFAYSTADTTEDAINVTWKNIKDTTEEYTTEYEKDNITYSDLISKIKDRILLKLDIDENDKVKVRSIVFTGNKAFDNSELRSHLDNTEEAKWWKFWSSAKFNPEKFEDDKKGLKSFYEEHGYRDAEVVSDSLIYSNDKKDLKIIINVYEGPQYKVRNITWEGNTVYPDKVLDERLDFKKGDIFNYKKFEQNLRGNESQSSISELYQNNGYLTFNLQTTETKVDDDSIDLNIRVEERNQFKIGQVNIVGNTKTMDKVIRRELYTVPGDYFNRALLLRSVQQLANLQYFNAEKLYGPEGLDYNLANDSTVNVTFSVEEKSSDYLNASVGYSGAYGFSGAIGVTLSNFSLAKPFSLGGGQILSFNWQFGVGNYYRTFTLGFTEPWFMNSPTLVGAEIFDTRQQYYYDLSQYGGTLRLGRRLKWPDDFFNVQGFLRYQHNDVIDGGGYYATGKTNQFTLGATIARKDIDNPIFPARGSNVELDAQISGGPFLPGDINYFKIDFTNEWYKSLFHTNRLVLYTASNLGYLRELDEATKTRINPYEKYFMGGNGLVIATTPLRGYDDRSVGPKDAAGNAIGGRVMARFTTELRLAVTLEPIPLYLLTFAEAGNVYDSFESSDIFDLRRSVGVGARILINPIGLIGFDLGYGFDRKAVNGQNPAWLFHFQFGKGF